MLHALVSISHGLTKDDNKLLLDIASMPVKAIKAPAGNFHCKVSLQFAFTCGVSDVAAGPCQKQWWIANCQECLDSLLNKDGGELFAIATRIAKYTEVSEKAAADRAANEEALNGGKK